MNRIAPSPALLNERVMVKAGKDGHAPAFGEALAALGRADGQPGHPVLPTDAGHLPTRRAEPPNGNRAQDADRADPADAGSREGRPARSASGGRNMDPWSEEPVPPTPDRDAVGTRPSTAPRDSTDKARTAAVPAMPALPGASTAAPAPDMDRTSPTRLPATSQDVTPAAAGLGRRQMAAFPAASSASTATGTARPDARNRVPSDAAAEDGDTGSVGPSADPAEPTQAASSPQTTAPPAMSTSPATLPEVLARDLAAPPSSAKVPEAKPDAAPIPRSVTAAGAAILVAAPAGQTGTRTPAATAAAPWPVSDETSRNETAFRIALAPNRPAAGKVAMAGRTAMTGRPAIQTDTASVTDDPAAPDAGQVATPQAGEPSALRPTADFTAGLLTMPPPTLGGRAAAPARTTAVEGTGSATAAAGRTGSDPDTFLQMDAMAAVTPRTTDAAVSGSAHVAHPTSQTLPVSVADQVAPMVLSAARSGEAGHRVTVSITPDELGRVNITVERNSDGTMHIQVSAEHLATLDLLRRDQDELTRTLNQAADSRSGHSLSFSLDHGPAGDGPESGMGGWSTQDGQQDARPSMPPNTYSDDIAAGPAAPAAARSGIDVTA